MAIGMRYLKFYYSRKNSNRVLDFVALDIL